MGSLVDCGWIDRGLACLDHDFVLDMADVVPDFNTAYELLDVLNPQRWPDHRDGPLILGFHARDIALDRRLMA
jgi:hypothetical protein